MNKDGPARCRALIEKYFDGCNQADYDKIVSCFTPDAAHYFPPGLPEIPWRDAATIARNWLWCVEHLGSRWTIENVLVDAEGRQAVIEWTHWKTTTGEVLRGDEWYLFDEATGLIKEIRAYYAAPASMDRKVNGLVGFDYAGRGYHLQPE